MPTIPERDDLWVPGPHALGAFRACRHGHAIAYRAVLESEGAKAVAAVLASLERAHLLLPDRPAAHAHDRYGVVDLYDANGRLGRSRDVPDRRAFDEIRVALSLRVVSSDCELRTIHGPPCV